MAVEHDAEHLRRLALVPGRTGVDRRRRGQVRRVPADPGPDKQVMAARQRVHVDQNREPVSEFINRGQPVEEVAAEFVAGEGERPEPAPGGTSVVSVTP